MGLIQLTEYSMYSIQFVSNSAVIAYSDTLLVQTAVCADQYEPIVVLIRRCCSVRIGNVKFMMSQKRIFGLKKIEFSMLLRVSVSRIFH